MQSPKTTINEATKHCQNAGEYLSFFAQLLTSTSERHFGLGAPESKEAMELHARALQLTVDFAKFRTCNILTARAK